MTDAVVRQPPQLLLDQLPRLARRLAFGIQSHWIQIREPAHRAGDIHVREDLFPAMPLPIHQHGRAAVIAAWPLLQRRRCHCATAMAKPASSTSCVRACKAVGTLLSSGAAICAGRLSRTQPVVPIVSRVASKARSNNTGPSLSRELYSGNSAIRSARCASSRSRSAQCRSEVPRIGKTFPAQAWTKSSSRIRHEIPSMARCDIAKSENRESIGLPDWSAHVHST